MRIRIGTRKSKLALWQANHLLDRISNLGLRAELVLIDSLGDIDKTSHLGSMNQTGIFTKSLDLALTNSEVDLAIHSLKDYPTVPPAGISITSTGVRENPKDVLVSNVIEKSISDSTFKIGTGSIRRKAQWLYKYPNTHFVGLRGNVPTRLEKLWDSDWDGIIMAYAGMARLQMLSEHCTPLDWMIPAPAQGILGISYRSDDAFIRKMSRQLLDEDTELCARVERKFLNLLEGGCSAPIGALAKLTDESMRFKACLHDPDGTRAHFIDQEIPKDQALASVEKWTQEILKAGGNKIMDKIKN